jgi:hypothetical protein
MNNRNLQDTGIERDAARFYTDCVFAWMAAISPSKNETVTKYI